MRVHGQNHMSDSYRMQRVQYAERGGCKDAMCSEEAGRRQKQPNAACLLVLARAPSSSLTLSRLLAARHGRLGKNGVPWRLSRQV